MVPFATETSRDQERIAKATWQAALLRQLADDLEQEHASRMRGTPLADAVESSEGQRIIFALPSGLPPRDEMPGPIRDRGAFDISVHP